MKSKTLLLAVMFVLANVLGFASLAHAGTLNMEFDNEIDVDGDPPAGTPPWVIATFVDTGVDTVRLTIQGNLQSPVESIRKMWFNTKTDINANALTIAQIENGGPSATNISSGQNAFGGTSSAGHSVLGFDVQLIWFPGTFKNTMSVVFEISGTGLTADSFMFKNDGGTDHFYAIAKVLNVLDNNNVQHDELIAPSSIPLPGSLLLGVIGLLAMPILVGRWGRLTA